MEISACSSSQQIETEIKFSVKVISKMLEGKLLTQKHSKIDAY